VNFRITKFTGGSSESGKIKISKMATLMVMMEKNSLSIDTPTAIFLKEILECTE
jgi:hypothetical protein